MFSYLCVLCSQYFWQSELWNQQIKFEQSSSDLGFLISINFDKIIIQLPGSNNPKYIKKILGKTAKMTFHLIEYRKNGLPFFQYIRCRNFALQHFIPDLVRLLIKCKKSGVENVNILLKK